MKLKLLFLSSLLMACKFTVTAQKYTEAILVRPDGDSINGFVKLPGSDKSPVSFKFSPGGTDDFNDYGTSQAKAVIVKNASGAELYESYAIRFESSPQTIGSLGTKSAPVWKEGVFFIQLLAKGSVNLYKFTDYNDRIHFFIAKAGEAPEELLMKQYMAGDMLATNDSYRSQLQDVVKDCPKIKTEKLLSLNYEEKKILKVISDYNNCTSNVAYTAKIEKTKSVFYIMAGASFSSMSAGGPSLKVKKFSSALFPSAGIGVNLIFPGNQKKSSIAIELLVRKQEHRGNFSQFNNSNDYSEYVEKYNLTYLRLNAMYRRFFTNRVNKPYFQVGAVFAHALQLSNDGEVKTVFYSSSSVTRYKVTTMDKRIEGGILAGIGLPIGKHSVVEARFEFSTGITSVLGSSSRVKTLYAFYCYRF